MRRRGLVTKHRKPAQGERRDVIRNAEAPFLQGCPRASSTSSVTRYAVDNVPGGGDWLGTRRLNRLLRLIAPCSADAYGREPEWQGKEWINPRNGTGDGAPAQNPDASNLLSSSRPNLPRFDPQARSQRRSCRASRRRLPRSTDDTYCWEISALAASSFCVSPAFSRVSSKSSRRMGYHLSCDRCRRGYRDG